MVAVYHIQCPTCSKTIWLLETMLDKIINARGIADTGDPFIVFVCSQCKTGFLFNYAERSRDVAIPEPDQTTTDQHPNAFFFQARCIDEGCRSYVELIAVRDFGVTKENVIAELPTWNLAALRCENDHILEDPEL